MINNKTLKTVIFFVAIGIIVMIGIGIHMFNPVSVLNYDSFNTIFNYA